MKRFSDFIDENSKEPEIIKREEVKKSSLGDLCEQIENEVKEDIKKEIAEIQHPVIKETVEEKPIENDQPIGPKIKSVKNINESFSMKKIEKLIERKIEEAVSKILNSKNEKPMTTMSESFIERDDKGLISAIINGDTIKVINRDDKGRIVSIVEDKRG